MSDVALLRLVLARELETINEYEQHAQDASTAELRAFFLHLAKEEKEHVSEAMAMIHQLDAEQAAEWAEVNVSEAHFTGEKSPDLVEPEPARQPIAPVLPSTPPSAPVFTIGSLKQRD